MDRTRFLIVGAGVSGLAFADWLGDEDYLVCDADQEIGGYCKTVKQDGFTWDYSGHFFHFRRPEIERYLVERMRGQRILEVERQSRIWFAERLVDFPFQMNIHQLPREDFLDCLVDLYFRSDAPAESFYEMLYAKLGKGISERFLIPYNEKLYATDLRRLDVDAMGRFFPHADVDAIIRGFRQPSHAGYNARFTYPEGGAIEYVRALARGVHAERIQLGERVLSIDTLRKVARTSRREIAYETLVSSAPFVRLLEMTGRPHDPSIYTYNKVEVWNLGFDRKGRDGVHWIYFPQRELAFYRVGYYDNIFGTDRMSLYVEIGRRADEPIDEGARGESLERVLGDLRAAGVLEEQALVSHHHVVLDPAYVHITRASIADVRAHKDALEKQGIHSIGRYGSWTYCSIEDNIVEARALADALRGHPRRPVLQES